MKTPRYQIRLDAERHEVYIIERGQSEREVPMAPKERDILTALITSPRTWTRPQLMEKVWGTDQPQDTRTVDQHLSRLRAKLFPGAILTVPGVGYKIARFA